MARKKTKKKAKRPARKPVKGKARTKKAKSQRGKPVARKGRAAQQAPTKRRTQSKAAEQAPPPPPRPGSFVWHELATTDPVAAGKFYSQLFGWKTRQMEMMPGYMYTLFTQKGQDIGGMAQIAPEQGDAVPRWDIYVSVKNVDATAAQCEALGGEVVIPPHDIPVGRWAALKDPTGAMIAIYKSARKR